MPTNTKTTIEPGHIVKYGHSKYSDGSYVTGLVLKANRDGGTLKVLDAFGNVDWFVTSYCVVLNERCISHEH